MMRTLSHVRATSAARCTGVALAALAALGAARAGAQCAGDCNGNGMVAINELIVGVNIALGTAAVSQCASFDVNGDGQVAINELIAAVNSALGGCQDVATATPTPTATRTTGGGTPTFTPTASASCGNGNVEFGQGETCDDGNTKEGPGDTCPANCRIAACQPSGETVTADVVFATDPAEVLVAGLTVFVRYPDGVVDVPGSDNDAAVQAAVTSEFFSVTPNDYNYGLAAVLIDPFFLGVTQGTAVTIELARCGGAGVPPASAFSCRVVDASDPTPVSITDQVTCHVELR